MGHIRPIAILVATAVLTAGSVAVAEPAGQPSFVPVAISAAVPSESSVVVARGDHLWMISQRHLDQVLGRPAADAEVEPYWRSLIEMNRDRLRSGDPDLIYPGEVISLPAAG